MIDLTREMVAYGIMGAVAVIAIPIAISHRRRRQREKLRRRGIKTYGH